MVGSATGWQTFTLDIPFNYSGNGNLVVCVAKTVATYSTKMKWYYTSVTGRALTARNDSDTTYAEYPTTTGTLQNYLPNIRLNMTVTGTPCLGPMVSIPQNTVYESMATVTWTPQGSETMWNLKYCPAGSTNDWEYDYVYSLQSPSSLLIGLSPATSYDVYVQAACSAVNTSSWSKATFTTACPQFATVPFYENFDELAGTSATAVNNLPLCWSYFNATTYTSYQGYPIVYHSASYANSPSNALRFNVGIVQSYDYRDQIAVLPQMSNIRSLMISFSARAYNTVNPAYLVVGTIGNFESTFVAVDTIVLTETSYNDYTVYLDSYYGTNYRIALKAPKVATAENCFFVDDIVVTQIPLCKKVEGLTVHGTSFNQATLSWTQFNSPVYWEVMYAADGDTNYITSTSTNFVLTELEANTTYSARVRSACTAYTFGQWSEPVTFTTKCVPYDVLLTYLFNEPSFPECTVVDDVNGGAQYLSVGSYAYEGARGLAFNSSSAPSGTEARLVLRPVDGTVFVSGIDVDFMWYNSNSSSMAINEGVQVQYSPDGMTWTDAGDFVPRYGAANGWTPQHVSIPELGGVESAYIGLLFRSQYGSNCYLDSLTMSERITCLTPSNVLAVANDSSVIISWTPDVLAQEWQIAYDYEGTPVNAMENVFELANAGYELLLFQPSTNYDFYVKSICSPLYSSDWSEVVTFTTPSLVYNIAVVQPDYGGSVTASATSAMRGDTVSLSMVSYAGYHFVEYNVFKQGDHSVSVPLVGNAFVMPKFDVEVTAVFEENPFHDIIVDQTIQNGVIAASADSAQMGTVISLTATASQGYHFVEFSVVKQDEPSVEVALAGNAFTMPDFSVFVSAVFEQNPFYDIVVGSDIQNGVVAASADSAQANTTVTLIATANAGYHFVEYNVVKLDNHAVSVSVADNAFQMPSYDVLVSATFEQDPFYAITISSDIENGQVIPSATSAQQGEIISLTVVPDAEYELSALWVYETGSPSTLVEIENNSFVMPAYDVTIAATFGYDGVGESEAGIMVYPNPTGGQLHIVAPDMRRIEIIGIDGQVLFASEIESDGYDYTFDGQSRGVYFVRIVTETHQVMKRVVVAR